MNYYTIYITVMRWDLKLRGHGTPIYRQFEEYIRRAIRSGDLRAGERIPSVAVLSRKLRVNKLTVLKAFRNLEGEGLVDSQVGKGTFVTLPSAGEIPPAPPQNGIRSLRRLRETYAQGLRELLTREWPAGTLNLASGLPPADSIAEGTLERLVTRSVKRDPRRLYGHAGPSGLLELREAVADRLGHGITPDQILVTNGSQQAITVIAAWALDSSRTVYCETPTYTGIPSAFSLFGHPVESIPWGELPPRSGALLYLCPDFHNPTGQTLSETRRKAIADWAREQNGLVVIDEIFRELRFSGHEPASLYELLPPRGRIRVDSLSKSFLTGLRVGTLVADAPVVRELLGCKRTLDLGGPALTQAIAADFLRDGFDAHLRRVRTHYRVRREAVLRALETCMPEGVTWTRPEGGFQLWVTLPEGLSSIQLYAMALDVGVAVSPGPAHDIDGRFVNCFRLGYGHLPPDRIRTAVERLAGTVRQLMRNRLPEAVPMDIHV
jgi:GntR family transcriptional regulator/MocR family aminotransferase